MLREEFIDMFEPTELSNRLKNEYPPLPIIYATENPKVKKAVATLRNSRRITKETTQALVNIVYENRNVTKLKETMEDRTTQTVKSLDTICLNKEPASLLALLVRGIPENLN